MRLAVGVIALGVYGSVTALGQELRPVGTLEDLRLTLGQQPVIVEFGDAFTPVESLQSCEVDQLDPTVVAVAKQDGFRARITPIGVGATTVTITAGNDQGEAVQQFDVEVVDQAPAAAVMLEDVTLRIGEMRGIDVAEAFSGTNLSFDATTDDAAASVSTDGATLTVMGLVLGTAAVTVTATNPSGEATQQFNVVVQDVVPQSQSPLDDLTLEIGETWSADVAGAFTGTNLRFAVDTPDSAASVSMAGSTLTILGLAVGDAVVAVTATNSAGEAEQRFNVTVVDVAPAVSMPLADLALHVGQTWAVDLASSFSGTNLSFDAGTEDSGVSVSLEGSMLTVGGLVAGVATVTVTVSNTAGSVSDQFLVTVRDVPAEVAGPLEDLTLIIGDAVTLELADRFTGTTLEFGAAVDDSSTATIAMDGSVLTVTGVAIGVTSVEVVASNSAGSVSVRFQVNVVDTPPTATGRFDDIAMPLASQRSFDLSSYFAGTSLTFSVSGGNAAVGTVIEGGTLTVDANAVGVGRVTVTARNSGGVARQSFAVTVALAPTTTGTLPDVTLYVGDDPYEVDVAANFNGRPLRYAVESSSSIVASASLNGTVVTVLPVEEGRTIVTVSAGNALGDAALSFVATVVDDPDEVAALDLGLAAIARNVLSSATTAIGGRLRSAASSTATAAPGSALNAQTGWGAGGLTGTWPQFGTAIGQNAGPLTADALGAGGYLRPSDVRAGGPSISGFTLNAAPSAPLDRAWAYWGQGDVQRFSGASYDGSLSSVYLGTDADFGERWRGGVAVSRSVAEVDYWFGVPGERREGVLETELVSTYPYASWQLDRGHVWAVLGAGWGEATSDRSDLGRRSDADLSMWMAALGGRHRLTSGDNGIEVSLVEDMGVLSLITDGGAGSISNRSVRVGRARLGLEASRQAQFENGLSLTPFVAAMARRDFGDGDTGAGLDLAFGLRYKNQPLRLGIEAKGHLLATHSSEDYDESGANLTISVLPLPDGSGLRLSISPRWGSDDRLDGLSVTHWPGAACCELDSVLHRTWSVDATMGYGLLSSRLRGVVVPFAAAEAVRQAGQAPVGGGVRVGFRYDFAGTGTGLFNIELSGGQRNRLHGRAGQVELRAQARF